MLVTGVAVAPVASAAPPKDAVPVPAKQVLELTKIASPNLGAAYLRTLGKFAAPMLAPRDGVIGALVALPKGRPAADFGLDAVAPGIGRIRSTPEGILAFADAHPGLPIEIGPPLQPLVNRAGDWVRAVDARRRGFGGKGVLVGVADTGLDVLSPDMRGANNESRVAWMLDLSLRPSGAYPELEQKFGVKNAAGTVVAGRVFKKSDLDVQIARYDAGVCTESKGRDPCAPTDEQGHGTHVTGIAAASAKNGFPGIAPEADIISVRIVRGAFDGILNDDLERAVEFMFDRADAEKKPLVVNLSLGADFGPHDGSSIWEQAIASHVGPNHPGRAIVAAAGNSGSIVQTPIHQSVHVARGGKVRVPVRTGGALESGQVQIWVTLRAGADLKIGLDGPDGEWIPPVAEGRQNAKNTDAYQSGVIYGPNHEGSVIPPSSRGAVVVWTGQWPRGTYYVTFEGSGMAELYLQGLGDAVLNGRTPAYFSDAVRENTITLPGTHPSVIAVGCTVNRTNYTSVANVEMSLRVPLLDEAGATPLARIVPRGTDGVPTHRPLIDGEVCWFSSAGPTVTGVQKPEISAPGALVASTVSRNAIPPAPGSIFTDPSCPPTRLGREDPRCMLVDDRHGISNGTSMSSPVVAGVVALLLQADPTLTQDKILALLQAGAHRFRASHLVDAFDDQSGPGEVDAIGSLDALEQMKGSAVVLPSYEQSWLTLSSEYVPADGSTPITAIVELRTQNATERADLFVENRLQPDLRVDGELVEPQPKLVRRGPGVWLYEWLPPAGLGGSRATFGATFDGAPIVPARTVPIATDRWTAAYPSTAGGSGCHAGGVGGISGGGLALAVLILLRASRATRAAPKPHRRDRTGTSDRRR